ncbi:Ger(x)C family spore germination protein [Sediminibacillus halophilus]|uniref:Germination protein, Ger(X)C family n=1 Tax=Sediminibacillus halophilus TaxID=482461 RepID=A0A1G9SWS4_9BACI|nr:Ger(x)C family spore germination protein [Sediminibacillus halophilus]SDM39834.1 germination protein, Ger(x)C family [Sediminibacillus halophilus]
MRKRIWLLILFLVPLTGCYDQIEVEQQTYVIAIGIDKTDVEGKFRITFQAANPEVGSTISSGGSQEEPRETVTLVGNDLIATKDTANSVMTKQIALDHTKVVVVSEELARSGEFLRLIQAAARTTELRRSVQIIVSKENASDFLKNNQPLLETRPHKYYQYMLSRATETGIIPEADIHRFFQITEGDADAFLAIYATTQHAEEKIEGNEDQYIAGQIPIEGGNPTQFMGSAVFKEGKMIDVLSGQETRIANILDDTMEMEALYSTYPDPKNKKYRIAANFTKDRPIDVEIDYQKDQPTKINITVPFSIEVIGIPSLVDYSQNGENRSLLEAYIPKFAEEEANNLIKKTQEEYKTDVFYWSLYIRKYFSTIEEYEKADWNHNIYPNAEINVDFKLKQLYFGKMIDDSNIGEVRD